MKTITVFALLVIVVSCAPLCVPRLSAAETGYAFSAAPQFGLLYGQAEEIVYPTDTKGELLSQLLWDMKPLMYYGLALDISPVEPMRRWGFFSTLSLKAGIPAITGVMEDRDWRSKVNDSLTDYSIHDNQTGELFFLDAAAGLSVPIRPRFVLKAYTGVSYMRFHFSGVDGYGTYAWTTPAWEKRPYSGKVINYTQEWLILAPGVSFDVRFLRRFAAELAVQVSPFIISADLDEHLTTRTQFRDYMRCGLFIEPKAVFSAAVSQWLALSITCSWRHISGTRGETYSRTIGTGTYNSTGSAGAGLSLWDCGLLFKIRL
jgi:outer membrane protease